MSTMDGTEETGVPALLGIAMSLVSDGDAEGALQAFERAQEPDPDSARARLAIQPLHNLAV
ncbi:hypothetical protein KAW64_17225, partial [bacterium]|nr:hypothetical protein [bacterium]